eukprot:gene12626-13916_t
METLKNVKDLLQKGDFLVKVDLKNAYYAVGLASQKFVRFQWEGTLYEYNSLVFGLGPAPRVFTKILKVPVTLLRKLRIKLVIYIDDMLILAATQREMENLKTNSYEAQITLSREAQLELKWWKENLTLHNEQEKPLKIQPPELTISSDAAGATGGWGAAAQGVTMGGAWTPQERKLHINVLEMMAAKLAKKNLYKGEKAKIDSPDHPYCRIYPIKTEHAGGSGITEHNGFQRMEIESCNLSAGMFYAGDTSNRPLCFQSVAPNPQIHELEGRPKQYSTKSTATKLGKNVPICFFPIQLHRPNTQEGSETQNKNDPDCPNLGSTTVIRPAFGNGHKQPSDTTTNGVTIIEPAGDNSPATRKQNFKTGGMADLGRQMQNSGLSTSASRLIVNARCHGTRSNYDTAWKKFSSWCHQKQVDPFRCPVNDILNFLAYLFDTKKEYRTINNYKSAISVLHEPIEGLPVGQHPKVKSLFKGISKERPPSPKYTFVWDVEQALAYVKNCMPNNNELNPKDLTQKLICLMGLTAISRGSELHALSINGICKINNSDEIFPIANLKHSKQGKKKFTYFISCIPPGQVSLPRRMH